MPEIDEIAGTIEFEEHELEEDCAYDEIRYLVLQAGKKWRRLGANWRLNEENMKKFSRVYELFHMLAYEEDGKLRITDLGPESTSVKVSAEVRTMELRGEGMKLFLEILDYLNTFEMKTTESIQLLISGTVKDVWEVPE